MLSEPWRVALAPRDVAACLLTTAHNQQANAGSATLATYASVRSQAVFAPTAEVRASPVGAQRGIWSEVLPVIFSVFLLTSIAQDRQQLLVTQNDFRNSQGQRCAFRMIL